MSETSTVQQGWLETRSGDKFAPNTLVENVYTRSGVKYDQRVREYIASINSSTSTEVTSLKESVTEIQSDVATLETNLSTLQTTVNDKFENFNSDDSNTFYIIDSSGYVVAYVDATGVHSVEFETKSGVKLSEVYSDQVALSETVNALSSQLDSTNNAIKNINADDTSVLYIIDGTDDQNVIAYIDDKGVHSVNFYAKDLDDYKTLADKVATNISSIDDIEVVDTAQNERLTALEDKTEYFDGSANEKLYITDGTDDQNVIAYFDGQGLHVINVLLGSQDASGNEVNESFNLYNTLVSFRQSINNESDTRAQEDERLEGLITANTELINVLNDAINPTEYSNAFYFIDESDNVIAYVDELGIHAVNFIIGASYDENGEENNARFDIYSTLNDLITKNGSLDTDISGLQSQLNAIGLRVTSLENWKATAETQIANLQSLTTSLNTAVTTTLPGRIDSVESTAQQNLTNAISQEVSDRNSAITSAVNAEAAQRETADETIFAILGTRTAPSLTTSSHESRIADIEDRLADVSNVMDFVGVFDTLPAAANYQNGDVCMVGTKEYVLSEDASGTKTWNLLGDVSAEVQRLDELETALGLETTQRIASDEDLDSRLDKIETHANWDDESALFIIDGATDPNVVAYFNDAGLTTVNVVVKDTSGNEKNLRNNGIYMEYDKNNTVSVDWL